MGRIQRINTIMLAAIVCISVCTAAGAKEKKKKYVIREGDFLSIIVYPAEELGREAVVQPDGNIELKLIGSVKAKGMTNRSLAKLLELRFSAYVRKPQVSVIIKKFSGHQLFVTGAIRSPGSYDYHEGIKAMELISEAGGVLDEAVIKEIRVIRGAGEDKEIINVNLDLIMNKGETEKDILLKPGDVVFVPKRMLARVGWFVQAINPWLTLINFMLLIVIAAG